MPQFEHTCEHCGNTVKCVAFPDTPLVTPREAEILNLLVQGKGNQAIADNLGIACRTVKSHIANLADKFHVTDTHKRLQLARYWSWPIFRLGAGYAI